MDNKITERKKTQSCVRNGFIKEDSQFDKEELKDTIRKLDDFMMKMNYDFEMYNEKDLDLMDKIYDYLKELEEYYG